MPVEPNKKAEELLRAYSRQRRADAANVGEMPGVTRNLLQSEVRKQFPAKPAPKATALGSLRVFWLKLACGSSVLALIAFGLFLVSNPPRKARQEELTVAANHLNEQTVPAENRAKLDQSKESKQVVQLTIAGANPRQAPIPALKAFSDSAAASTRVSGLEKDVLASSKLRRDENVVIENARSFGAVVVPTSALAFSASQARVPNQNGIQRSQQYFFTQQQSKLQQKTELPMNAPKSRAMEAGAGPRSQNLLVNFTVETAGDQVRIVDSDGSIYAGRIGAEVRAEEMEDLKKTAKPIQNFDRTNGNGSFWAKGTNVTLRKEVTLAGTLQIDPMPSTQRAGLQTAATGAKRAEINLVQQRAQIQAVARIGTNETQINAVTGLAP